MNRKEFSCTIKKGEIRQKRRRGVYPWKSVCTLGVLVKRSERGRGEAPLLRTL